MLSVKPFNSGIKVDENEVTCHVIGDCDTVVMTSGKHY